MHWRQESISYCQICIDLECSSEVWWNCGVCGHECETLQVLGHSQNSKSPGTVLRVLYSCPFLTRNGSFSVVKLTVLNNKQQTCCGQGAPSGACDGGRRRGQLEAQPIDAVAARLKRKGVGDALDGLRLGGHLGDGRG